MPLVVLSAVWMFYPCATNAQWTDGQAAFRVLGQADFTTLGPNNGGISASTLAQPDDVCVDVTNSKLYVVDASNNRILRYVYPTTSDQQAAELVFGQANFTDRSSATAVNGFNNPAACDVDSAGRLWVVDRLNRRVLWFDDAYNASSNQPDADGVLGQANFTTSGSGLSQSKFNNPYDLAITTGGTLFVADRSNNRVLRFDNASAKSNGANADGVLGQSSFTTNSSSSAAANTMNQPHGVAVDASNTLWVADYGYNRVLRFDNAASKSDGANADGVLGQSDFTSSSAALSASGMSNPCAVAIDGGGRLYVLELSNERITIFDDAANKSDGASADNILGQSDFVTDGSATTASGLSVDQTAGLAVDSSNDQLWLADTNNSRVVGYQASSALPVELVAFDGVWDSRAVVLRWTTASETNNAGFDVQQYVVSPGHWRTIGFIEGHGTTVEAQTYQYRVEASATGSLRFRLKQVDFDGTFAYSPIVELRIEQPVQTTLAPAYPNPFNPTIRLTFSVASTDRVSLRVYDALGREVALLFDDVATDGVSHTVLFQGHGLASGLYHAVLHTSDQLQTQTLWLVK